MMVRLETERLLGYGRGRTYHRSAVWPAEYTGRAQDAPRRKLNSARAAMLKWSREPDPGWLHSRGYITQPHGQKTTPKNGINNNPHYLQTIFVMSAGYPGNPDGLQAERITSQEGAQKSTVIKVKCVICSQNVLAIWAGSSIGIAQLVLSAGRQDGCPSYPCYFVYNPRSLFAGKPQWQLDIKVQVSFVR